MYYLVYIRYIWQHRMITCLLLARKNWIRILLNVNTQRQHSMSTLNHILSPKPSPAILSTKIRCFCSYFHLVLLLSKIWCFCLYFHIVPLGQFHFTFVFKIPFRHFVCFGKIINCTAVQLMK
jgi:hypothetical protein